MSCPRSGADRAVSWRQREQIRPTVFSSVWKGEFGVLCLADKVSGTGTDFGTGNGDERETETQLVLDFPQELPGSVHNKIEGPLGQIRPIRSFAIRQSVAGSSQRGRVCARPDPAGPGGRQEIVASGERIVASGH